MRIGVVGDTHDRMSNVGKIVELLRAGRVERVVHTGDVTRPPVLARLAELEVPLFGVFGNNDRHEREELARIAAAVGMEIAEPPRTLEWAGRRVLVVHDPEEIPSDVRSSGESDRPDLILHGHTHRHRLERLDHANGTLVFNPGECAGRMPGRNAVGIVDLVSFEFELLRF